MLTKYNKKNLAFFHSCSLSLSPPSYLGVIHTAGFLLLLGVRLIVFINTIEFCKCCHNFCFDFCPWEFAQGFLFSGIFLSKTI